MPGQPKNRAMLERLEELGDIDWLCEQVAGGNSLLDIAANDFDDCSRHMLQRWIRKDPDRKTRYEEAKREGAAAMVEQGMTILDDADENTAAVQKAGLRANYRKWYAGVVDRQSFGPPDRRTSININNIEHLHLAALQAHGGPDAQIPEASADVQLLESGDKSWEESETE